MVGDPRSMGNVAILNVKVSEDLTVKVIIYQRPEVSKRGNQMDTYLRGVRIFLADETASAKTLKWEHACVKYSKKASVPVRGRREERPMKRGGRWERLVL